MLVTVDCYNCGSSENSFFDRENGYDLVSCDGCGLLYIRERPSDSDIDSNTAIGKHHGDKTLHVDVYYNRGVLARNRQVLAAIFNGDFDGIESWLDIGCGHGEFLESVAQLSTKPIELFGSEPNIAKQKSARSRGLNVDFFDLDTHEGKYDMVSLLNVYSHLADPNAFIASVKNVVAPGGGFLIQTGNVAGLTAEDIIKPLGLPDHLSFATEEILVDMLERHGFQIVSTHKFPTFMVTPLQISKEIAKIFLPSKSSYLKYYANYKKYQATNMYIRAKLPSD